MAKKKRFDPTSVPIYVLESEDSGLTQKQEIAVWQHGVDTGEVWHLQGWYGRTATAMLDDGTLHFPRKKTFDAYGNPIPTQAQMKKRKKMERL